MKTVIEFDTSNFYPQKSRHFFFFSFGLSVLFNIPIGEP